MNRFQQLIFSALLTLAAISCSKDDANYSPYLIEEEFYIQENPVAGSYVGTISAFDVNKNDSHTFAIVDGNNWQGEFALDNNTGVITVLKPWVINYEYINKYWLKAVVSDNNNPAKTDTCLIYINVQNKSVPQNGLVAFYSFNNTLKDSITGDTAAGKFSSFFTDRNGNYKKALSLIGYQSYAQLNSSFDYVNKTVSLWFNLWEIYSKPQVIYCADNSNLQNGKNIIEVAKTDTTKLYISIADFNDSITIGIEQWYHVVFTISSGKEIKIYVNNELKKTSTFNTNTHSSDGNNNAVLGANRLLNANYFAGLIDDIYVYSRVLSANEINLLYTESDLSK